jgi:hypothetical protein
LAIKVQEFKGSRVQGFKSLRVTRFQGSRVSGFKRTRVQLAEGSWQLAKKSKK